MEHVNIKPSLNTAEAGPDIRILRKTWKNVVSTEAQLELISKMVNLNLGFPDVEEFLRTQSSKLKSSKFKFNNVNSNQVNVLMKSKLADAVERNREAQKCKERKRGELHLLYGKNTRRVKNVLRRLNREMRILSAECRSKNKMKIEWLLNKYRPDSLKENNNFVLPEDVKQFENAKIFDPKFVPPEDVHKPEVIVIGDLQPPLDSDEIAALVLPPKTAVTDTLNLEDFKCEVTMCSTKLRWEIGKEEEEKTDVEVTATEAEQEIMDEVEAKSRIPYDPHTASLDLRRRKVTDTKDNSRIYMPKPISLQQETNIHVREGTYEAIFNDYCAENCDVKGRQLANLSKQEMVGIKKLKKRVNDGSIVVMECDKSGKFAVATMEEYLKMGQVHVSKDKEIDQSEVDEREHLLNGHVSMLLKVTNMGENWQHEKRFRESNIKHSGYVSLMTLLCKDHKGKGEDGSWSTRPVVAANEGIGTSISNILSEILEPLADSFEDKTEVISTEDFLHRVDRCNELLSRDWAEGEEVVCIGSDIRSLFPSLSPRNTARILREQFVKSKLEVEGANLQSAAMYVRYGMEDHEIRALGLARVVPRRRYTRGRAPGIGSKQAMSGDADSDGDKWIFPDIELTELEKRTLLGACIEIGVRTAFENSVYSFGGRYYLQCSGASIGARLTMAAARVTVHDWAEKFHALLDTANIKRWMKSIYVDDYRLVCSLLNIKFNEETGRFEAASETKAASEMNDDEEDEISPTRRFANELRKAMDSINPDLKFVLELEEDFNGRLPSLDTSIWFTRPAKQPHQSCQTAPFIEYEYFEKSMSSQYCVLECSAMEYSSKYSILSQELVRRLFNTSTTIPQTRVDEIVDKFALKLLRSGYNTTQVRQIFISGIRGYHSKVKLATESGHGIHRSAATSLSSRMSRKIFGRESWFKGSKNKKRNVSFSTRRKPHFAKSATQPLKIKSILFVPFTKGANGDSLCKRLKMEEQNLSAITKYKIKYCVRNGTQLRRILCKNPFSGLSCGREFCKVKTCKDGSNGIGCRRRNIHYLLQCDICSAKVKSKNEESEHDATEDADEDKEVEAEAEIIPPHEYIGEAIRSSAERCEDHYNGLLNSDVKNPMFKHKVLHHPDEEITFTMSVLKKHSSSFSRQCAESVAIEMRRGLLNSKNSFNRCSVPRLQVIVDDKPHSETTDDDIVEVDEEKIFIESARRRRKKARRNDDKNAVDSITNPCPPLKRRKHDLSQDINDTKRVEPEACKGENDDQDLNESRQVHSLTQQKQAISIPSNNYFSIFNKQRHEQGKVEPGLKKRRHRKTVNPPQFKYKSIENHFGPTLFPEDQGEREPA